MISAAMNRQHTGIGGRLLDAALRTAVKLLLALRYRVRVRGLEPIARRGRTGILFLPNHPALIDPIILLAHLHGWFAPRALADRDQISRPGLRWLARRMRVIPMPDIKMYGSAALAEVKAARETCSATLASGGNVLFYPSGHIYRTRYENLRGNSGVEQILRSVPGVRVVLVRTRGLWGSGFSLAGGEYPRLGRLLWAQLRNLLLSYVFFMPRRDVTIELWEPRDFPRHADRNTLNAFLEDYYNQSARPNARVAYRLGARPRRRVWPEPTWMQARGAPADVPALTRQRVVAHLCELTGAATLRDDQLLAQDLGLDSLARTELLLWLGREFGCTEQDGDMLVTVGDVLLAACGEAIVTRPKPLTPPPPAWYRSRASGLQLPSAATITAAFLAAARRGPDCVAVADQLSGTRTYRELITAILALRPLIRKLDGRYVGIMLPASVGATVAYWAALFAGKIPVMINWTTGARALEHSLDTIDVRHVLSAGALVERLESQGVDLGPVRARLVLLEELARRISRLGKLWALVRSYVSWAGLDRAAVAETAVVLVTSGSESLPKAVPLTHENVLVNIRDALHAAEVRSDDCMLGFLPPFHSFGLIVTVVAPLVAGLRVVYHASPTEAYTLAQLVAAYRVTLLLGTPTFLGGILRAARDPAQLASVRLVVTGAEKCPERIYRAFATQCPHAIVLEGYGITECSPIVAVNGPQDARPGTVGRVLPAVEYVLVDSDTGRPVVRGQAGMLLVRGPSIFGGYLGSAAATPFVEHDGKQWYRTGDLLTEDHDGVLTFRGRLTRFVKIGGEMVSLPAIEAALAPHYVGADDEGPVLAVSAAPAELRPELVLFCTRPARRETVNQQLRAAGLSGLHNISRVIQVAEIPLLGNGKTDYRALGERLRSE